MEKQQEHPGIIELPVRPCHTQKPPVQPDKTALSQPQEVQLLPERAASKQETILHVRRADWVKCRGFEEIGFVKRLARDGSWADVEWCINGFVRVKRMPTRVLEVQTEIAFSDGWRVIDLGRECERLHGEKQSIHASRQRRKQ